MNTKKRLYVPMLLMLLLALACQLGPQPATSAPTSAPATDTSAPPTAVPPTNTVVPPTHNIVPSAVPTTPPASVPPSELAAATATAPATATSAPIPPTFGPPTGLPGAPTSSVVNVNLTPAQLAAVKALTKQLQISIFEVSLVSTEPVNWPDGCLGVALPGVTCTRGPVPGFRIKLGAAGRVYEYHTNQDGTSVISTQQGFTPLRVAVRAADDSVKIVDTGFGASQASQVPALLPMGGSVGSTAYVLDFKDQERAQVVDQSGTKSIPFVQKPNYGLAVWPGNGAELPRLAWATSPTGQPPAQTVLYMANVDGSGLTPVVTETIAAGQPPYQIVAERWSTDGQSLYFSREPVGIGGYIPFAAASSLYRYNLADKTVTELVPFSPQGGKMLCLDDLTPDATLAVSACVDPKAITVHSLAGGGADRTITAPGTVTDFGLVGSARFSPNGQRVAFALAKGDPTGELGWVGVSDGLSGQSNFVALSHAGQYYTVVAWLNANTLLLQDNVLTCSPTCVNSLWTIGIDGANLTKLTDGTFLTLVGGK